MFGFVPNERKKKQQNTDTSATNHQFISLLYKWMEGE